MREMSICVFDKIANYFVQCVCRHSCGLRSRSWQCANDVESYNTNEISVCNEIRIGANPTVG